MTRSIVVALTTACAVAIFANYSLRDGAIVLASFAGVAAFAFGLVFLRRWATRGCGEVPAKTDSTAASRPDNRTVHTRRAA